MAENKTNIYAALCKAQQSFKPAVKDTANPFFKSKYADLASIWDACKDALAANDLFVSQSLSIAESGTPVLITKVYHISGESIESTCPVICAKEKDPQAFGSAVTYTRRYSLAPLLGIITDDDDGEGAMVRPASNVQPKKQLPASQVAVRVSSKEQKAKIAELLDHEYISPDIQSRGKAALEGFLSFDEAETKIKQLEDLISKRTTAAA